MHTATIDCTWVACRVGAQDHAAVTTPSELNPTCTCHKLDGARLVHRHESGCPGHAEFHHPENRDCRRYCA